MAWKITLSSGAEMYATDKVRTPDGVVNPSTLSEGDFVCMFPDGHMPVEIQAIEELE